MPRFLPLLLLLGACAAQPDGLDRRAIFDEVLQNYRANLAGMRPTLAAPAMPALEGAPEEAAALLGQPPEAVERWLGPPALRRREGTARIWLYQGRACSLDLVLDSTDSAPPRVIYAAARATGTERQTEAGCLTSLAAAAAP